MSTFPLFTKYAWIGHGFHSVKEIPNHGHSIYGVDWGAQPFCGEISHRNSTKKHIKSNQHMSSPHAFSNYAKQHSTLDSSSQKLTWVISKEKQPNMDPASWKLTEEEKSSSTTHQVDASSWKLSGEENSSPTTHQVDAYS